QRRHRSYNKRVLDRSKADRRSRHEELVRGETNERIDERTDGTEQLPPSIAVNGIAGGGFYVSHWNGRRSRRRRGSAYGLDRAGWPARTDERPGRSFRSPLHANNADARALSKSIACGGGASFPIQRRRRG